MGIKNKIIISITVVGIISIVIFAFIILPTVRDIKKISAEVYNQRVDLEKKYLRGQLLKKTADDFEKIKPQREKLINTFVAEGEELKFITTIEKIATAYGLTQNIDLEPSTKKSSLFYPAQIQIKIQGDFIKTLKYLNDIERLNYYVDISSFKITQLLKSGKIIDALFTGNIYILPQEKDI